MNPVILNAIGIVKGGVTKGTQDYTVIGKDKDGNDYLLGFSCMMNHTDSIDKAFSRLFPIKVTEETTTES